MISDIFTYSPLQILGSIRVVLHLTVTSELGTGSHLRAPAEKIVSRLEECPTLMGSSIVRKYRTKLATRNAESLLGKSSRRWVRGMFAIYGWGPLHSPS
jgi:hypothetical protein